MVVAISMSRRHTSICCARVCVVRVARESPARHQSIRIMMPGRPRECSGGDGRGLGSHT